MKKLVTMVLLNLLIISGGFLCAKEIISEFSPENLPYLNEELRTLNIDLESLKSWSFGKAPKTLTITSGVVTVDQSLHAVDTEAAGATDDLVTINGGNEGSICILYPINSAHTVVFKDGTGNLKLEGDFSADNSEDKITLVKIGINWHEITRANNGA